MAETFGYTAKGGNPYSNPVNQIRGYKFQSGSAGSLASITAYVQYETSAGSIKCAIYDASLNLLSNGGTEEKQVEEGQDDWMTFNFGATKPEVAAATFYHLCWWSAVSFSYWSTPGTSGYGRYKTVTYNGWPTSLADASSSSTKGSIYATYYEAPPPAVKTLVQAALISIPPLVVLPTLREIIRFAGGC